MGIKKARNNNELSSSGVVKLKDEKVVGFVEKPKPEDAPSRFINIGKYIISTDIAKYFPKECRFSFERDFLQNAIGKINVYAYRTKVSWYPTDTFERLKIARSKWPVAR
jgi:mannose-1-phosphate guanylyltransferase